MRNGGAYRKNILRSITGSLGRYLAIVSIIALGVTLFSGLRVSTKAMVRTADEYMREYELFDFRVVCTLGFTEDDVRELGAIDGVKTAAGCISDDFIYVDSDGVGKVLHAITVTENVNKLQPLHGRMPEKADECVVDALVYSERDLGKRLSVLPSSDGEDDEDLLASDSFTIVGIAASPCYISEDRGTTSLNGGKIYGFAYMLPEAFDSDYYTDIYIRFDSSPEVYSEEYEHAAALIEDALTKIAEKRGELRYISVLDDAWNEIRDARRELDDGWDEYNEEKTDAEQELSDALKELEDGRNELDDGWQEYNDGIDRVNREEWSGTQELKEAEEELAEALDKLNDGETEYKDGKAKLDDSESDYAEGLSSYEDGRSEYEDGLARYNDGLTTYNKGKEQLDAGKVVLDDSGKQLADSRAKLDSAKAIYSAANGFYSEAGSYGTSLGYGSAESFVSALQGAAYLIKNADSAFSDAGTSTAEALADPATHSAEITAAALSMGYSDAAAMLSELQPAMLLYQSAAAVLAAYVSDYNVAYTVVSGFIADWQYYSAALDGALDNLAGTGTYALNQSNLNLLSTALAEAEKTYSEGEKEYTAALADYNKNVGEADASKKKLDVAKSELDVAGLELDAAKTELDNARQELDDGWNELNEARAELDKGWNDYKAGLDEIKTGWATLRTEIADARTELADAKTELTDGETEYSDGVEDYYEGVEEFDAEISDALKELDDGEAELSDAIEDVEAIKPSQVFVMGRGTNVGYASFKNDSQIVSGVARVFPLFFFLIAALVCVTTMTRMIDEERTQIGVMKSLGYSTGGIVLKYMLYAGSAALLGSVVGLAAGMTVLPHILWSAYDIMYGFADLMLVFDVKLALFSVGSYLACTLGATWFSCRSDLQEAAAELIRPRSPQVGKRVLLERFPLIWKRFGFLFKVSLRNTFRYKKRLFMMLIGIGGCSALLLTGFGIRDSIQDVADYQYGGVSLYDCSIDFADPVDDAAGEQFREDCGNALESAVFTFSCSVDVDSGDTTKSVYLCAADTGIDTMMDFHIDGDPVPFPAEGECIINEKIADMCGLKPGDELRFCDSDLNYFNLTVGGVYENYVNNYIFTSLSSLGNWAAEPELNSAYVTFSEAVSESEAISRVSAANNVASYTLTSDMKDAMLDTMGSLDIIIVTVILFAAALAFIVLYNLTNINIIERIREIATLKVLGFYAGETAQYVFRESLLLCSMGAVVGIPLGRALHAFVMAQIQVDIMSFDVRVDFSSYLYAFILTLVFSIIVDIIMYFRIERINMAEALKSVE